MLEWILGFYGLSIIAVIILAIGSWFIWDRRYKNKTDSEDIPDGFVRTNEVFIDPSTKKKMVVYFHPETGKRIYREE